MFDILILEVDYMRFCLNDVVLVNVFEKSGKSGEIFKYVVLMDPETYEQCELFYSGSFGLDYLLNFLKTNVDVVLRPNRLGYSGFTAVDIKSA